MTEPSESVRQRAKQVFDQAVDLPAADRAAAVERLAGGDAALRAEVESLLRAHDQAEEFLRDPTVAPAGALSDLGPTAARFEGVGSQVGPYRLVSVLGEGGFGTVFRAEQERPVRRQVALKLIKLGMDTRQVVARFEAERQALAMMEHPNIARVFDAGATDTGRPYFVMELVEGVPITRWCDEHRLPPRERLELFVPVAQAVQHAHTKGIIHRDIKPSNVLVALQDGRPVPKVIDFGVAKATEARLTEQTLFTEHRQLVGTPEYMSPEQAELGVTDIDTRSDIYSLGVLLYELLVGVPPFDGRALRSKAFAEMQRTIREVDPPRPSTRLSELGDDLPSLAANRRVEPARLSSLVRGELDWIVMKCLEKDRARRYQTAAALGADVLHFLSDEPVSAAAPSRAYLLRKFARRHRVGLSAAGAVLAALLLGLVLAGWGFLQARRERDGAVASRREAEAAQQAEAEARAHEQEIDRFLTGMFASIDPQEARGRPVLVNEILDGAVSRMDSAPPGRAPVEAALRLTFGRAYLSLGALEAARRQLERALELYRAFAAPEAGVATAPAAVPPGAVGFAQTLTQLGVTYLDLGELEAAEDTLREAAAAHAALWGPDSADTINSKTSLGEVLVRLGRYDEAERLLAPLYERAQRAPEIDAETLLSLISTFSTLRERQGGYAESERLLRDGLAQARRERGGDHPVTLAIMGSLGDSLRANGKFAEAVPLLIESRDIAQRVLGPDHPQTLTMGNNLALTLATVGRLEESVAIYEDTISRRRRVLGEDSHLTLLARSNYGLALQAQRRFEEAEATFRDVAERMARALGPGHPDTIIAENNIAWLKTQTGDPVTAERIYRDLVPRARTTFGPESPAAVALGMRLGVSLLLQDKWTDAETPLAEAYRGAQTLGTATVQAGYAGNYGIVLVKLGKAADGLPLLLAASEMLDRMPRPDLPSQRRVYEALIEGYEQLGRPAEAAPWRDRLDALPTTAGPTAPASTAPTTTSQPTTRPADGA